ncbi:MAG TPA: TetR/AcrR family transcriptional regulator [Candidatus Baltobacteraceae bacterium]|nr:TetR/AcrR family transcriptional regulator [Candidatus Baltobacteraceae bacterium]
MKRESEANGQAAEREPRGARRKRETRRRLLEAAFRLVAERGIDAVAVNEITEAADVGFGSFYNHFESKESIYSAVVEWLFEDFADWLDRLLADVSDPARVLSGSVRYTMLRAQREPLWGRFLVREGFSVRTVYHGLGRRLLRDIRAGIAAERFSSSDSFMSFIAVAGTVLAALSASSIDLGGEFSTKGLPERTAAVVLRTLGIEPGEADAIAAEALPE